MEKPQKYTEARRNGNKKWDAANLDRMSLALPKGRKDDIKTHAEDRGESMNGFISRAIDEQIIRDTAESAAPEVLGGGVVYLPSETIKSAQEAAQAAGEGIEQFLSRAIHDQADRDAIGRRLRHAAQKKAGE